MLRGRSFLILVVVTAAAVAGAMATLERETRRPQVGELVFADLLDRVNDVTSVVVSSAGERFTLDRKGTEWAAPERDGYPVVPDMVHRLLVGAAGLERLEPKTSNPERFAELGLRDPTEAASRAVGFELRDASAATVATLIVGERRPAKGDPTRTEYFVRVPGEARAWLVRGTLPHDAGEVLDWLQKRIVSIDEDRIARVRVAHADGEVVTVARGVPGEPGFEYQELPDGAQVKDTWRLNDLGRMLADLSLDDVRPATGEAAGDEVAVLETETYDGMRVTLRLREDGEEALATLGAAFDPALAEEWREHRPESAPDEAAVREEVASLNARWQPWVYVLPRFKADTVRYRQADLAPPAEPAGDTGASG